MNKKICKECGIEKELLIKDKMQNNIPYNYKEGIPRVSDIVEFTFPFKGTEGERRFHSWLYDKDIKLDEYMEEASNGGKVIHSVLEQICLGEDIFMIDYPTEYQEFVHSGFDFIQDYKIVDNVKGVEKYFCNKDYQGTIDLIARIDGEDWILDWKTYNLSKHKFGLHNGKYRKPNDKLKKARLQLSLYAMEMKIKNIAIIEITKEGYHFHKLKLIPNKEIKDIILEFKNKLNEQRRKEE